MIGILTLVLCVLIAYVYIKEKNKSTYWKSKDVVQTPHKVILGLLWDYITSEGQSLGHILKRVYDEYPDQLYVGCFLGSTRTLVLRSPDLFRHVLRTEFKAFNSRGANVNFGNDTLGDNVLFMEGVRWRLMRQKLTPVFTGGKLRNMFYIINESGKRYRHLVDDMREKFRGDPTTVVSTYTMSSISASVFGIEANPGKDLHSQLHLMAKNANTPTLRTNIQFVILSIIPNIVKWLNLKVFGEYEFFVNLVKSVLKTRKESGVVRHDFIDNCLDIQKEEFLRDSATGYSMATTDELMAGQAFFFFIAGVEPTATAMNFSLYELSRNPDIQEALQREIDEAFGEKGDLTLETVEKMELLEKVLSEAMRMYPPIPNIQRKCLEEHVLPGGLRLEKDTLVTIPILGVHMDPQYYPDPDVFDPERFAPDAIKSRPNYVYLPFGEGNRICIGLRFAKLQAKAGLAHLLRHFSVRAHDAAAPPPPLHYIKSFFSLRCDNFDYTFVPRNQHPAVVSS